MNVQAFASRSAFEEPFPHFVVQDALGPADSSTLLGWLETNAPWRLKIAEFYQQYEFSLCEAQMPPKVAALFSPQRIADLKRCVADSFNATLAAHHDITVHKLVQGQRIRIHNDFIPGQESHRVLVQLNRDWVDANGGALLFFKSQDARDISKGFRPVHDSCVAFEISPQSHHAVTPIVNGDRYTLVYSFYRASK